MAGEAAAPTGTEPDALGNGAGPATGDGRAAASPTELPEHVADTGDRVPDLRRPDHRGHAFSLYEHHIGRPLVLLALTGDDAADRVALAAIVGEPTAGPTGLVEDPGLAVVAPPGVDPATVVPAPGRVPALADDGTVARLLGADLGTGPRLVVLDAGRRVVANLAAPSGVDAAGPSDTVRRLLAGWPAGTGGAAGSDGPVRTSAAPLLIVPHVLDPQLCAELIDHRETTGDEPSRVHRMVDGELALVEDPSVKVRRDHTVTEPLVVHELARLLHRRLVPEMARTFGYVPGSFERFKLVRYDAGAPGDAGAGRFTTHRDNATADVAHRRFALTLVLDDGYEGGELHFPEHGPDRYRPPAGAALVFPCSVAHEVLPVTAGTRHVLITFFADAPRADAPAAPRS
ncbi:MAG: 2OG-Fe(II) oxygenase [Actinomycetota bacterium]|nr:2OG-Fe(II) oxygenase [Actinomycetota bacterium]